MSDSLPDTNPRVTNRGARAVWKLGGIFLAGFVVGLAYSRMSPVGLPSLVGGQAGALATNKERSAVTAGRTSYTNETLSVTLELDGEVASRVPTPSVRAIEPELPPIVLPTLNWPQVKSLLASNQIVLVDTRFKASYDLGHIPGAVSFPSHGQEDEDLWKFANRYAKGTRFVLYCGSETCGMWRTLAENLARFCGFTNVYHMPGGYMEYFLAEGDASRTKSP